jgi:hypothetical protein
MLSAEHGKDFVLGRDNLWMCLACQPWLSSHDIRLARREIVHYQHTLAKAFCMLLECTSVNCRHAGTFVNFLCGGLGYDAL